ncbi:hypothetical protein NADFUDRAFT_79922 [Nadsonia fulvescens var. elongata DSM 6958]|uniref:Uncharacterized protein n=1 Tax=Nadsonia fulvescens var. elongata DSM 6958 TaxID=857566 RepID=A0A1E3PGF4_9ASCO|nr:hypothetical protein NADFUDRAFT_79922 [Nadsonia fulvescens var. elongata DSM 6958]
MLDFRPLTYYPIAQLSMNEESIIRERITHQTPYLKSLQKTLPSFVAAAGSGDETTLTAIRSDLAALRLHIKKLQLQYLVADDVTVDSVSGEDLQERGEDLKQTLKSAMARREQKIEYDTIVRGYLPLSRQDGSRRLEDLIDEINELQEEALKSRDEWNERKALWAEMKLALKRLQGHDEDDYENHDENHDEDHGTPSDLDDAVRPSRDLDEDVNMDIV